MNNNVQLPVQVHNHLNVLLARKTMLLDTIEQIKLEKAAYINDMQNFRDLYSSTKTSKGQENTLASAQIRYTNFIKRIEHLKSCLNNTKK